MNSGIFDSKMYLYENFVYSKINNLICLGFYSLNKSEPQKDDNK